MTYCGCIQAHNLHRACHAPSPHARQQQQQQGSAVIACLSHLEWLLPCSATDSATKHSLSKVVHLQSGRVSGPYIATGWQQQHACRAQLSAALFCRVQSKSVLLHLQCRSGRHGDWAAHNSSSLCGHRQQVANQYAAACDTDWTGSGSGPNCVPFLL